MLNPFRPKTVKTREQLAAELEAEELAAAKAAAAKAEAVSAAKAMTEIVAAATAAAKAALPKSSKSFDAAEQEQADAAIKGILRDLPELLGVAVIDLESGQFIAKHAYATHFSVGRAASCYAAMVKQQHLALAALDLPDEHLEEILIALQQQLHLLRVVNKTQWLLYVSVSQQDANLGVVRDVMRRHSI